MEIYFYFRLYNKNVQLLHNLWNAFISWVLFSLKAVWNGHPIPLKHVHSKWNNNRNEFNSFHSYYIQKKESTLAFVKFMLTFQYGRSKRILRLLTPWSLTGSSYEFSTPPFLKNSDLCIPHCKILSPLGLCGGSSYSCCPLNEALAFLNLWPSCKYHLAPR